MGQSTGVNVPTEGTIPSHGWRSVPLTERSVSYMKGWVLGHQQKKFLCLLNPHPSDTRFLCPLSFLSLCL